MSLQPFIDAMHVKVMPTLTLDRCTIFSCVFALGTRHLEGIHANDTMGITDVPVPGRHSKPTVNSHSHFEFNIFLNFTRLS